MTAWEGEIISLPGCLPQPGGPFKGKLPKFSQRATYIAALNDNTLTVDTPFCANAGALLRLATHGQTLKFGAATEYDTPAACLQLGYASAHAEGHGTDPTHAYVTTTCRKAFAFNWPGAGTTVTLPDDGFGAVPAPTGSFPIIPLTDPVVPNSTVLMRLDPFPSPPLPPFAVDAQAFSAVLLREIFGRFNDGLPNWQGFRVHLRNFHVSAIMLTGPDPLPSGMQWQIGVTWPTTQFQATAPSPMSVTGTFGLWLVDLSGGMCATPTMTHLVDIGTFDSTVPLGLGNVVAGSYTNTYATLPTQWCIAMGVSSSAFSAVASGDGSYDLVVYRTDVDHFDDPSFLNSTVVLSQV